MPKLTAIQHLGFAKETTWGTPVAPTRYMPFNEFSAEEELGTVVDESRRGNITKDYGVIPTTLKSNLELSMFLYPDIVGVLFKNMLPNVTTTGTGPYVHTLKAGTTQSSLTFQHFNGADERQYAGVILDEITISGETTSPIEISVTGQGKSGQVVATTTPTIETTLMPITGAMATLKVDTVANANLASFEITIARENRLIYGASATQEPTKAVQGRVEVTGSLSFEIEDATEYEKFKAQQYVNLELTIDGGASNKIKLTMPRAFIETASWDDGEESLKVDWEFRAVYEATAAGPIVVELTNSTATL